MTYLVLLIGENGKILNSRWFNSAMEAEGFCSECPLNTLIYAVKETI